MSFLNPIQQIAGKIFGRGPKVDGSVRLARLAKCYTCPAFIKTTKQCKKCLCFAEEKARYQNEKCKLNRW
jgi:hypothetical protein